MENLLLEKVVDELNWEKLTWLERPIDFPIKQQYDADEVFTELDRKMSIAINNRYEVALKECNTIIDAVQVLVSQGFAIPEKCCYIGRFFG